MSDRQPRRRGVVLRAKSGIVVETELPDAKLGERVTLVVDATRRVAGEVVGFTESCVYVMAYGRLDGMEQGAPVLPSDDDDRIPVGDAVRGCVLSPLGKVLERHRSGPTGPAIMRSMRAEPPEALSRPPVNRRLVTGVRVIDAMFPLGMGQRIGIFAGAGGGKSTLLGCLTRHFNDVEFAGESARPRSVVVALIGERGKEVRDFIDNCLGSAAADATVVYSTSDEAPVLRLKAAYTAATIAEHERDQGKDVLFIMDSVTRFARAQRDLGLALEEAPGRGGFPPSVFAELPRLFERAGTSASGSVTAIYSVLMDSADGALDVVAEETKSLLDGHLYLRPKDQISWRPAIDVVASESRVASDVLAAECAHPERKRREAAAREIVNVIAKANAYRRNLEDLRMQPGSGAFARKYKYLTGEELWSGVGAADGPLLAQDKDGPPTPLTDTLALLDALAGAGGK